MCDEYNYLTVLIYGTDCNECKQDYMMELLKNPELNATMKETFAGLTETALISSKLKNYKASKYYAKLSDTVYETCIEQCDPKIKQAKLETLRVDVMHHLLMMRYFADRRQKQGRW